MAEPMVMTVTGPMPAAGLGVTDAHDHLFIRSPALAGGEIEDLEKSCDEVVAARASGIGSIIEMTPIGLGRRPELMRQLSERTGVPVIAASGFHRDVHYPAGHWVYDASVETLAERIGTDLEVGMHPANWDDPDASLDAAKAGVIKAGASYQHISEPERRRLDAAAIAGRRVGVAILVHTEIGTCGHEIVDALLSAGASPDQVILAHLDRNPDLELHAEIAARGVNLVYDTIGRIKYRPDSVLIDLIARMIDAGHGDRLMLGLDLGTRDYFRSHGGGPGMRYLMDTFVPRLRRRLGDGPVDAMLVANPTRAFAIREGRA
jgi:phosphotriesterase-related protein